MPDITDAACLVAVEELLQGQICVQMDVDETITCCYPGCPYSQPLASLDLSTRSLAKHNHGVPTHFTAISPQLNFYFLWKVCARESSKYLLPLLREKGLDVAEFDRLWPQISMKDLSPCQQRFCERLDKLIIRGLRPCPVSGCDHLRGHCTLNNHVCNYVRSLSPFKSSDPVLRAMKASMIVFLANKCHCPLSFDQVRNVLHFLGFKNLDSCKNQTPLSLISYIIKRDCSAYIFEELFNKQPRVILTDEKQLKAIYAEFRLKFPLIVSLPEEFAALLVDKLYAKFCPKVKVEFVRIYSGIVKKDECQNFIYQKLMLELKSSDAIKRLEMLSVFFCCRFDTAQQSSWCDFFTDDRRDSVVRILQPLSQFKLTKTPDLKYVEDLWVEEIFQLQIENDPLVMLAHDHLASLKLLVSATQSSDTKPNSSAGGILRQCRNSPSEHVPEILMESCSLATKRKAEFISDLNEGFSLKVTRHNDEVFIDD